MSEDALYNAIQQREDWKNRYHAAQHDHDTSIEAWSKCIAELSEAEEQLVACREELAAARESLETRSLLLAEASKGLALAQKFGDALALELCYAEKAESERLESEQALSDWRELWEGQSNEWKERHHVLETKLDHLREQLIIAHRKRDEYQSLYANCHTQCQQLGERVYQLQQQLERAGKDIAGIGACNVPGECAPGPSTQDDGFPGGTSDNWPGDAT